MSKTCKYTKNIEYVSYDNGETWKQTGNFKKGDLIEENSTDCGYDPEGQYKWEVVEDDFICGDCEPLDPHDSPYYTEYLTIEALTDGSIRWTASLSSNILEYSIDGGEWVKGTQTTTLTLKSGNKIRFKGNIKGNNTDNGIGLHSYSPVQFSNTEIVYNVYGNIHSLLYGDDFVGNDEFINDLSITDHRYIFLFIFNETKVVDASNLILPAKTLIMGCYRYMFSWCYSLAKAPVLPATTLADDCYYGMFDRCYSLTKAPVLPATTLAESCYRSMFSWCYSLAKAPELPATTLAPYCYDSMFSACYSLQEAPALFVTTLANYCYRSMFSYCYSLAKAPELPATTLAPYCYDSMFAYCTLQEAPELPATTLEQGCYNSMFSNCTNLNEITTMQLNTPIYIENNYKKHYNYEWVENVSPTGTIYLNKDIGWWTGEYLGISGIPDGWDIKYI